MKQFFLLPILLLLIACGDTGDSVLHGYVEVEPIYLAANTGGYLKQLFVRRGDEVKMGQSIFVLEDGLERVQLAESEAHLVQAKAQAADLATGQREDEIVASEALLRAAQIKTDQSKREFQRQQQLLARHLIAENVVDVARATRDADQAHVSELQARLRVGRLAARDQQRVAAQANIQVSEAQRDARHWQLDRRILKAPIHAHVEQTFYRVGEWIPMGVPVVELLDTSAIKIRFYVPEPQLQQYAPGKKIQILCDGCKPQFALVTYQSNQAEFTPPVIYSRENRAKLVYLVEAKPDFTTQLRPGQPVDVVR